MYLYKVQKLQDTTSHHVSKEGHSRKKGFTFILSKSWWRQRSPGNHYQILDDLLSSGPDCKQSSLKHKVKKARISIFTVLSHFLWQIRPKYLIFTLFSIKYGNDYRIYLYAFSWSQLILDMLYKIS